jgi:hypothetical protein
MVRNVSLFRILVGVVSWLAPNLAAKLFGLNAADNPQAPYLARLFGVRDLALGAGALQSSGETQKQLVQLGLACDVADIAAGLLGRRAGYLNAFATVMVTGGAVAAAAMSAAALGEIDQAPSSSA